LTCLDHCFGSRIGGWPATVSSESTGEAAERNTRWLIEIGKTADALKSLAYHTRNMKIRSLRPNIHMVVRRMDCNPAKSFASHRLVAAGLTDTT